VVNEHPLDNGLRPWRQRVAERAAARGLGSRVVILAQGRAEDLLPRLAGVVTINSTVGLSAILAGVPVKVLGRAIYDLPGLGHPGHLDRFWRAPRRPDPAVANAFERFLRHRYHVPGTFDGPGAIV